MSVKFANNASSTLMQSITAGQTNIQVVNPVPFPTVTSPDWFYATISAGGVSEIIKVTNTNIQTFTCVRGADGTIAQSFPAGASVELRMTRASLQDLQNVPLTKTITVEAPGAAENIGFFYTPVAITLSSVTTSVIGTEPSIDWMLMYGASRMSVGLPAASGRVTSSSTAQIDTQVPAGSFLWVTTNGMSGNPLEFQLTVRYSAD